MSDNFDEQKDVLLAIKREINLLQQQVDFLVRNKKPLGLLDLDVLMNRTHTLYDLLCGVDVECGMQNEECGMDDEELPVGVDEIKSLFGIEEEAGEEEEFDEATEELLDNEPEKEKIVMEEQTEDLPEEEEPEEEKEDEKEEEGAEENESAYFIEEADDEEEPVEEPAEVPVEEPVEEPKTEGADDMGFILNFEVAEEEAVEPVVEETPEPVAEETPSVFTTGDEIEMTITHEIPAGEETPVSAEEEDIVYEPVVIGDMTDHDDGGFELEQPETVGERYQQEQEETVGERLQHSSVRDLQSAIGINDKFLFVNELFGGSMEKYNRSIENLNDLKTLNGALIYLNELRIELQWNSNNEAYKKLLELVHRKFEN